MFPQKEILNIPTNYAQNPQSMLQYEYKSVYFVCRKPKALIRTIMMPDDVNYINGNGYNFSEELSEVEKDVIDDTCSENDDDEAETN